MVDGGNDYTKGGAVNVDKAKWLSSMETALKIQKENGPYLPIIPIPLPLKNKTKNALKKAGPIKRLTPRLASDHALALDSVTMATGMSRGWESVNGLETGVGNEFYFEHPKAGTYYVCVDQGEVTACQKQGE
jgi:hypothetical protein